MDSEEVLRDLIQAGIDVGATYDWAIENVGPVEMHRQMVRFRAEHERQRDELAARVRALGGTPPPPRTDLKGVLLEGLTLIRSLSGTEGALRAIQTAERFSLHCYEKGLSDVSDSDDIRPLLQTHAETSRRHLAYLEAIFEHEPWSTRAERGIGFANSIGKGDTYEATMDHPDSNPFSLRVRAREGPHRNG